jgi:hypothetical protein
MHGSSRRPARRACARDRSGGNENGQLFTVKVTSSDDFGVPSLTAEDVKAALLAKAIDEDVPVEEVTV